MSEMRSAAKLAAGVARETLALLPVGSLLLAAAAVASTLTPLLSRLLIDLREGSRFEPWRPFTGHLVHGSSTHLLLDLAAFVPLAALRERRAGTGMLFVEVLALAAGVAAGIRLLHDPSGGIAWTSYCGLSGIVYGLAVIVLLDAGSGSRRGLASRWRPRSWRSLASSTARADGSHRRALSRTPWVSSTCPEPTARGARSASTSFTPTARRLPIPRESGSPPGEDRAHREALRSWPRPRLPSV